MEEILINLRQKSKRKGKKLTFENIQNEIVNYMYNKTIVSFSSNSLNFYLILPFLCLEFNNKILLLHFFEYVTPKLEKFVKTLNDKNKLKKGEYSNLLKEFELENHVKFDILFIIFQFFSISNLEFNYFISTNESFFKNNDNLKNIFIDVYNKYSYFCKETLNSFNKFKIEDIRHDIDGNILELSKSIYNPINMRLSKKMNLAIESFSDIKEIKSNSPIDIVFLQNIDPEVIILIWNKFQLSNFIKEIWNFGVKISNNSLISTIVGGIILNKILISNSKRDKINQKEIKKLQKEIKELKESQNFYILSFILLNSLSNLEEKLNQEIDKTEKEFAYIKKNYKGEDKEQKIKYYTNELEDLRNLEIKKY